MKRKKAGGDQKENGESTKGIRRRGLGTSSSLSPGRTAGARRGYRGMAPFGVSDAVSAQYLEQWLNDTLSRAEDVGIVGVLARPEHAKPLSRYGLDRVTLQGQGLKEDDIRDVYRALSVHSSGLFDIIRKIVSKVNLSYRPANKKASSTNTFGSQGDLAKGATNIPGTTPGQTASGHAGKIAVIQGNLWRVYQILIEQACPTDYLMLSQQIEKENAHKVEEMKKHADELEAEFSRKDQEMTSRIATLKKENHQLEVLKEEYEAEKQRVTDDLQKVQNKLEEEVRLRLFFE